MIPRRSLVFNLHSQAKIQCRAKYEWVSPVGHDTGIKIYNELAKRKVPLIFPNPNYVKWYMCGPTVYDTSHIGHASCYVTSDIIRRILKDYFNINPVVAIGVTDVSEKILERCEQLKNNPKELSKKYETEFFSQLKKLNVLPASLKLRVSDHIPVIINFVGKLVDSGAAYKAVDGCIYFRTMSHPNYGRFKEPVVDADQEIVPGKMSPLDFALWKIMHKKYGKNKGLPGWHIQCSAMASHVFGSTLDLHSGGNDLIFPHHENEESQSTSYHGCQQWVNYWIHTGLIRMGDEKMSKSLDNYISINEFFQKYNGDHLRMFCMMSPYRSNSNYDSRVMDLAVTLCDKVVRFLSISDSYVKGTWLLGNIKEAELLKEMTASIEIIKNSLCDDFSYHNALKCMQKLIQNATKMLNEDAKETTGRSPAIIAALNQYVNTFFKSFGFSFAEGAQKSESPTAVEQLIDSAVNFRMKIREKALFLEEKDKKALMSLCDETRDNLQSTGIVINDLSPSHTHWSLKTIKANDAHTLKNVIDILVWFRSEVLKLTLSPLSIRIKHEISELCRWEKMHLATLGVIIDDSEDGRSRWNFPLENNEATAKYEVIISNTVKFYADVRKIALSLTDENSLSEAKQNILALCDKVTSDLEFFGVIVNKTNDSNQDWFLEVNNNKGISVVQNIIDMIISSREQVRALSPLAKRKEISLKLDHICFKVKKFLKCHGLNITDHLDRTKPVTWTVVKNTKSQVVIKDLLDILVMFMTQMKSAVEPVEDPELWNMLLDIHHSLEEDLKKIGVVLVTENSRVTWSFKDCEMVSEVQ